MSQNTKYISEATEFINYLHKSDPMLHENQLNLRRTWWDIDTIEEAKQCKDSNMKHLGYTYFNYKYE